MRWFRKSRASTPKWTPPTGLYVTESDHLDTTIEHLNGIPWYEADIPPKKHDCYVQTHGWIGLDQVHRCACGGISRDGVYWMEKNDRKS